MVQRARAAQRAEAVDSFDSFLREQQERVADVLAAFEARRRAREVEMDPYRREDVVRVK